MLCVLLQSNLSNPPTPPSSLPPTPPPSVQHKLLNGLTAVEELPEGQKERERESAEEPMGKGDRACLHACVCPCTLTQICHDRVGEF